MPPSWATSEAALSRTTCSGVCSSASELRPARFSSSRPCAGFAHGRRVPSWSKPSSRSRLLRIVERPRDADERDPAAPSRRPHLARSGLSAWLFVHGALTGERVLVHGAAGGVGHLAVQLARARGAYVIGTASAASVEAVHEFGADDAVDHSSVRFEDVVSDVDRVFDTAGGERLERSPAVLRPGGRLVSVATERPRRRGITTTYFVVEPSREQLVELAEVVDQGRVRPAIDEVFPLVDARKAFERSEGEDRRGKIVLRVADD